MSTAEVRPFTVDDLAALPEDGLRHEILAGVHVVSPAPSGPHQFLLGDLYFALRLYLGTHPIGILQFALADVILSPIDVLEPDLFFVAAERMDLFAREGVRGAPDLVVEVLSPGTSRRDRGEKRAIYERFGVREYWLPDPDRRTVEVFRRQDDRLALAELLAAPTDALSSPLLPGFTITLAEIFRELRPGHL